MNTTRKHLPWFVAAGSALALTGTLVVFQPWHSADAVAYGAETTAVAVAEAPAPTEAAPTVEAAEAPNAEVAAEAPTATATSGAVSRGGAIQLALVAAEGGSVVEVSQGFERGIPTWEILVRRNDGSQVEVYVARNNGQIVKVENANDW